MSRIKSGDTSPERAVRRILHGMGYRFRLNTGKRMLGKPDIVLPKYRVAIFVHGCFWHRHKGCRFCYTPKTRIDFWQRKFESNMTRDGVVRRALQKDGWHVVVIWECELRKSTRIEKRIRSVVPVSIKS